MHDLVNALHDETQLQSLLADTSTWVLLLITVLSIVLLSKGADWMVDGVVHIAQRTGLSKIFIGATIVSLGTTMPEAFVSVMASYLGNPGLALGNGVGSIIVDTGLIFGLTCILARVPVSRYLLNRTGWVQVGAATLLVAIAVLVLTTASDGQPPVLEHWVGYLFIGLLGLFMLFSYRWAKESNGLNGGEIESGETTPHRLMDWVLLLGGLVTVIVGARILVPTATEIALRLMVPQDVIAATLVALGTSLPELITAIASVRKGHPEIALGNIVGADVLNVLFVIGASAVAAPLEIPQNFYTFHFPTMLLILYSFRVFITMNRDGHFRRWQGVWLLAIYAVYVTLQYTLHIDGLH